MKGVDLFAGCGGFTSGAEALGVEVSDAANHWDLAVRVHAANHPRTRHHQQDLRQFDFATLDPFDVLLASPACQGHSRAGRVGRKAAGVSKTHDNLRSTAWAVVDCLEVCRPKFAVIENVPEFTDWVLLPQWIECMRMLGYVVTTQILTASRWGVPQRRRRLFIVAHHEGAAIELSDPDVEEPGLLDVFDESIGGWQPIAAMRKTTSKKGHLTAREKVEIAHERLGGALGWGQHTNFNAWGRPMSEPVLTLTTAPSFFWWTRAGQYRLWSRSELAAAMTFPNAYDFLDANKKDSARLIGNAVPVKLAEGVIQEVLRYAA